MFATVDLECKEFLRVGYWFYIYTILNRNLYIVKSSR